VSDFRNTGEAPLIFAQAAGAPIQYVRAKPNGAFHGHCLGEMVFFPFAA
jgi:hypothetical protein